MTAWQYRTVHLAALMVAVVAAGLPLGANAPSADDIVGRVTAYAMRYGSVPVVRAVGGLIDTVFDRDHSDQPPETRNGYTFENADFPGIESALSRAIGLWFDYPEEFLRLMSNAMTADYSWAQSAERYLQVYESTRSK